VSVREPKLKVRGSLFVVEGSFGFVTAFVAVGSTRNYCRKDDEIRVKTLAGGKPELLLLQHLGQPNKNRSNAK